MAEPNNSLKLPDLSNLNNNNLNNLENTKNEELVSKSNNSLENNNKISILKSPVSENSLETEEKKLYEIKPYHIRLKNYLAVRDRIFNDFPKAKYKRNTLRIRNYYKKLKNQKKLIINSVFNNNSDMRLYAQVSFLEFKEQGMLDTGANISCIGSSLATENFKKYKEFHLIKSQAHTADGKTHDVVGYLNVNIEYKNVKKQIFLYIIPSFTHRLILGIDFWRLFNLAPGIINTITVDPVHDNRDVKDEENLKYPLDSVQTQQLEVVKNMFPSFEKQGLGRTSMLQHTIDVGEALPIKQRYYPVSPAVENLMYQEIDRMLSLNVIELSNSPWSSPMRLVVKPHKVRLCLDARKINSVTKKDAYPLQSIDGIFSRLPKAEMITKLDLKDAYWQVELEASAKQITAFTVPGRPLYQFRVMPFGLCNAPSTMCRLMDQLIPADLRHCVFGYLDDLIIVSETFDTHLATLVRIADQFKKANLTLNISKSNFCVVETPYLGYIIGNGGIKTDPSKIDSILEWPVPKTIKQVKGFLGLCGWYRRFIHNFADATFHMNATTSTKKKFEWTAEAQTEFEKLKQLLTTAPILHNADYKKKFYLHCDASNFGIGAVLVQLSDDGAEMPVSFFSKKLNKSQRNYSVTEKECLAAMLAIKKYRCYLELQEFEIITDHSSLLWLMKQQDLNGRLARWAFKLQGYKFTISHRKGKDHVVPDALSRNPEFEIASIELANPPIDLNSEFFNNDPDYVDLKSKISKDQANLPDLRVVDQYVYIRKEFARGEGQEENIWKLFVPKQLRNEVLSNAHDNVIAAHGGMGKTLDLIRRYMYWPGLVKDVRGYVRNCSVCKETKAPNNIVRPPMGKRYPVVRPFQRLYIDLLGPYPRSKNGNIGLLIVVDHFSKFHWLCPLRKFTSKHIQEFLIKSIFHCFGVPETIISDNGSQFKANELNSLLTKLGINHLYTALYSPQSNAAERVNRSLIAAIRAYLKNDHTKWDENLTSISCSLRNSLHQTIKFSPFQTLFGFHMVTHGSQYKLLRDLSLLEEPNFQLAHSDKMELMRQDIQENICKANDHNAKIYNLRSKPVSYQVGQEVYRRNFAQSNASKNFNAKFSRPFLKARIKEKLGSHYYTLDDLQGNLIGTFHAKDIHT